MNFFKKTSISIKIILTATLLAAIFLSISLTVVLVSTRAELASSALRLLEAEVENERDRVQTLSKEAYDTTLSLAGTPPVYGIIRARDNNGFDETENSTLEQWKRRLSVIFISEINSVGLYDQLRYIDENGDEVVRVDLVNGVAVKIPDDLLQNKKDRDYFIEASSLGPNRIYVSHARLNREGTPPTIVKPYKPVVRYATPIFDEITGERRGVIIANVLLDKIIVENYVVSHSTGNVYIISSDNSFFVHPEEEKEWGDEHDLDTGIGLFTEFPNLSKTDFSEKGGSFIKDGDVFVYSKAQPDRGDSSREWLILERTPVSSIFEKINRIIASTLFIGLIVFVALFFAFSLFIRWLLSPLKTLSKSAEDIGKGNFDQKIKIKSDDEIGQLANAFNIMTTELKEFYKSLEDKVALRTKEAETATQEMKKKVSELERLNKTMIGRELEMIELKKKIKKLSE